MASIGICRRYSALAVPSKEGHCLCFFFSGTAILAWGFFEWYGGAPYLLITAFPAYALFYPFTFKNRTCKDRFCNHGRGKYPIYGKCPDISSGQFLRFWMFQQFVFLCSYDLVLKISFLFVCKIKQIIDINQISPCFLRKNARKRFRLLMLFFRFPFGEKTHCNRPLSLQKHKLCTFYAIAAIFLLPLHILYI